MRVEGHLEKRCARGLVVTEPGSYLRLIDCCITPLKAQGPSRTCNERKEEEEEGVEGHLARRGARGRRARCASGLLGVSRRRDALPWPCEGGGGDSF